MKLRIGVIRHISITEAYSLIKEFNHREMVLLIINEEMCGLKVGGELLRIKWL